MGTKKEYFEKCCNIHLERRTSDPTPYPSTNKTMGNKATSLPTKFLLKVFHSRSINGQSMYTEAENLFRSRRML